MNAMRIDGHYDAKADIAWLRFEDYDPKLGVAALPSSWRGAGLWAIRRLRRAFVLARVFVAFAN
jgi:hypothetical protein